MAGVVSPAVTQVVRQEGIVGNNRAWSHQNIEKGKHDLSGNGVMLEAPIMEDNPFNVKDSDANDKRKMSSMLNLDGRGESRIFPSKHHLHWQGQSVSGRVTLTNMASLKFVHLHHNETPAKSVTTESNFTGRLLLL